MNILKYSKAKAGAGVQSSSGGALANLAQYIKQGDLASWLSQYLTIAAAEKGWVTVDTEQTVTGAKRFTQALTLGTDAGSVTLEYRDGGLYVGGHVLSSGEITAYASGGASGGMTLGSLSGVDVSGARDGYGLVYRGGVWVAEQLTAGGLDESQLATYLSTHGYLTQSALSGYATQSWVEGKGYLTQHQSLAGYYTATDTDNHFVKALYGGECDGNKDLANLWNFRTAIGSVYASSGAPANDIWYNVIQLAHRNVDGDGSSFVGQIALGMTAYHEQMFFRTHRERAWQWVLTVQNYTSWLDSRYVNKAGDTMSGTLTTPKLIIGSAGGENLARAITAYGAGIDNGDGFRSNYINVGYSSGSGNSAELTHFYKAAGDASNAIGINFYGKAALRITYGGIATMFGNTLWHSGNDGSGSGLDADLLDGVHNGLITASYIQNNGNAAASEAFATYGQPVALYSVYNNGYPCTYGNVLTVGGAGWGQLVFGWSGAGGIDGIEHLYYRNHRDNNNQTWSAWRTIAFTTDNVASASKLQTARSLWGNSFDGTADVGGGITFSDLSGTNSRNLLYQKMADNDFFRIMVGGTASNAGYAEIATADDGTEPIYVRQYSGVFATVTRTLTLLDGSGNTSIPGNLTVSGEVTAYSDARLKSEIEPIATGVRLRPVSYVKDGRRQVGLIAQDVAECCPTAVHDGGEYLALNYSSALTYALAGVYSELDSHSERIERLERENRQLRKEINRLKQERI